VRVERAEHTVDRPLEELLVIDLVDVAFLDPVKDLAEELREFVELHVVGALRLHGLDLARHRGNEDSAKDQQGGAGDQQPVFKRRAPAVAPGQSIRVHAWG
jgi:hypothetical protein